LLIWLFFTCWLAGAVLLLVHAGMVGLCFDQLVILKQLSLNGLFDPLDSWTVNWLVGQLEW
jgi:hypothetical protein